MGQAQSASGALLGMVPPRSQTVNTVSRRLITTMHADGLQLRPMLSHVPYKPPLWAATLKPPEYGRIVLSHAATPVFPWRCPALQELGVTWSIKRDDLSGLEISGNKARKLEFLLAEAVEKGYDCILTVGGMQSNHCRATAADRAVASVPDCVHARTRDRTRAPSTAAAGAEGVCGKHVR